MRYMIMKEDFLTLIWRNLDHRWTSTSSPPQTPTRTNKVVAIGFFISGITLFIKRRVLKRKIRQMSFAILFIPFSQNNNLQEKTTAAAGGLVWLSMNPLASCLPPFLDRWEVSMQINVGHLITADLAILTTHCNFQRGGDPMRRWSTHLLLMGTGYSIVQAMTVSNAWVRERNCCEFTSWVYEECTTVTVCIAKVAAGKR